MPVGTYARKLPIERFIDGFDKRPSGCWEWTKSRDVDGYGYFYMEGAVRAHRASWLLLRGEVPDGLQVLHRCDNPSCVNPAHLFLGTNLENIEDMHAKRRHRAQFGESRPNAKLCNADIPIIRARLAGGDRVGDVARDYGISSSQISGIKSGKGWAKVS